MHQRSQLAAVRGAVYKRPYAHHLSQQRMDAGSCNHRPPDAQIHQSPPGKCPRRPQRATHRRGPETPSWRRSQDRRRRLRRLDVRCRRCDENAAINMRQHKLALCARHFPEWFVEQTARTIHKYLMFTPADRILVAVSGGKDSLALWDVLLKLGYKADGLYIDLGHRSVVPRLLDPIQAENRRFRRRASQRQPHHRRYSRSLRRKHYRYGTTTSTRQSPLLHLRHGQTPRDEPRRPRRQLRRPRHGPQPR